MGAFMDAMKTSTPGALYECRESGKLESWVKDQTTFIEHESNIIDKLQKENLSLVKQLDQLKLDAYDNHPKEKPILRSDCFEEISPIKLPSIPNIKLTSVKPPLMSKASHYALYEDNS